MSVSLLRTLLMADFLTLRTWLSTKRFSKLFVIISFLILFWLVIWGIYLLSKGYFQYISTYKTYGLLTAAYAINASVLVLFVLMIMAAVTAIVGFLLERSPEHEYILSLPVPSSTLPTLYFIRTTIINIFLIFVILGPIAFAYEYVFQSRNFVSFYGGLFCTLVSLVLLTNCIATFISYLLAYFLKKQTIYTGAFGLLLFFSIMFGVFYLIFPKSLFTLSESQSINFLQEYYHLPITSQWLPTVWITDTLLRGFSLYSLLLFSLTFIFIYMTFLFQKRYFIEVYHHIHPQEQKKSASHTASHFFKRFPFLMKDYLSIIREPSNAGYVLFLSGIATFFFIFLRVGLQRGYQSNAGVQNYFAIFSFLWMGFFVTAFLLRIIYPLMSQEGTSRWFIFSLPIEKKAILSQKIIFGYAASIPIGVFSIIMWYIIPFTGNKVILIFFSLVTVFFLTQAHILLGAIVPDFENGDTPERVSTSAMGIAALALSFLYISVGGYLMFSALQQYTNSFYTCLLFISLSLFILILLTVGVFRQYKHSWGISA